jgi:ATP-binding cassette subfamily C protein
MSAFPRFILETLLFVSILLYILVSIFLHKSFSELVPMMTLVGMASLRLLPSVNKIYSNINYLQYSKNSLDIVYNILNEINLKEFTIAESECVSTEDINVFENNQSIIRLENITFRYESAAVSIFEHLNLSIPFYCTVAFIGATGAGKSTLIDILIGLLTPSIGKVCYKGTTLNEQNLLEYRSKIGYVPQQILLLDDSLEANIAFGVPAEKIDSQQIEKVIRIAQLESLVKELPQGIKTEIGERGVRISGGQRQRVGIARAFYHNPEIIVLDEATSSLDDHTEAEVNRAINQLSGKLTIIIIAHRLSTIKNADIIYVMENGRIVDKGNFHELLHSSAIFQKITNQKEMSQS